MAKLISDNLKLKPIRNIYSYDFDSIAIKIGRKFFPQVEFIEQDITELDISNTSSSIIINTSCEHIDQEMLYKSVDSAPTNTLFVLQSNNFVQIQRHPTDNSKPCVIETLPKSCESLSSRFGAFSISESGFKDGEGYDRFTDGSPQRAYDAIQKLQSRLTGERARGKLHPPISHPSPI